MKLGNRARYSLRLMLGIHRLTRSGKPVSLQDVARVSGVSRRYLDQLTTALKNAALIRGRSGRGGGYVLARPPDQIKVGEILQASSGPLDVAECVTLPDRCIHAEYCTCRLFWRLVHLHLDELMNSYSLADLLEKEGVRRMHEEMARFGPEPGRAADRPETWSGPDIDCPRSMQ